MIKKVLKIVGILAAGGFAIGLVWYFQSLKIDGDPLLTTCWAVDIYDDVTGEKVVGAEDIDFDPATGTVFLSAYDRRAVDRELVNGGPVTTQGGIYTFNVADITEQGTLNVTDISRAFKESGNEFRPHGFEIINELTPDLFIINRVYSSVKSEIKLAPVFIWFKYLDAKWLLESEYVIEGVCNPYDVLVAGPEIIFTDVDGVCQSGKPNTIGTLKISSGDVAEVLISNLSFPNGLIASKVNMALTQTRDKSILIYNGNDKEDWERIELKIAPDNLTTDLNNNLYVAGFPNLLDYYFYMSELFGVTKSPSAAYRISPDDYAQELLFKDDGTIISGATVAQRARDYLILGSGWDDNIAICSGMGALD